MGQAIREWWYLVTQHKGAVAVLAGLFIVVALLVFVGGVITWEYTNSTAFCGTTCHTMPPEFIAYEQSPHARVACVDCHLGQENALNAIPRKIREFRLCLGFLLFYLELKFEPARIVFLETWKENSAMTNNRQRLFKAGQAVAKAMHEDPPDDWLDDVDPVRRSPDTSDCSVPG